MLMTQSTPLVKNPSLDDPIHLIWESLIDSYLEYLQASLALSIEIDGLPNSSLWRCWINHNFLGYYRQKNNGLWYVRPIDSFRGKTVISEKACHLFLIRKYLVVKEINCGFRNTTTSS